MVTVAQARPTERAQFIRNTYLHLAGAIGAFVVVEFILFQIAFANLLAGSRFVWLGILAAFSLIGWMARSFAAQASVQTQYLGLGLEVVAQAIIFAPLLYIAAL